MKLTCSKCGLKNDRLPQRYCRKCHAANMRANRPKHQDLPELQRKKANARAYANVYLRRGLIQKMPCITCGNENAEKHHPDYDKPLQIVWLCKVCHIKHHRSKTWNILNSLQSAFLYFFALVQQKPKPTLLLTHRALWPVRFKYKVHRAKSLTTLVIRCKILRCTPTKSWPRKATRLAHPATPYRQAHHHHLAQGCCNDLPHLWWIWRLDS